MITSLFKQQLNLYTLPSGLFSFATLSFWSFISDMRGVKDVSKVSFIEKLMFKSEK